MWYTLVLESTVTVCDWSLPAPGLDDVLLQDKDNLIVGVGRKSYAGFVVNFTTGEGHDYRLCEVNYFKAWTENVKTLFRILAGLQALNVTFAEFDANTNLSICSITS